MPHTGSWSLPISAVTLLFTELGLGELPTPFESEHPYTDQTRRARFVEDVHADLLARGLLRDGELDERLAGALRLLTNAPCAVLTVSRLDHGLLVARSCWTGAEAVHAVRADGELRITRLEPVHAISAIVDLLPPTPAAGGASVRVPTSAGAAPAAEADDELDGGFTVLTSSAPDSATTVDQRLVDRIFTNPVVRGGMLAPVVTDRTGASVELPPMTWFDTADRDGDVRHFTTTKPGPDGRSWTSYVPGDNTAIAQSLREIMAPFLRLGAS